MLFSTLARQQCLGRRSVAKMLSPSLSATPISPSSISNINPNNRTFSTDGKSSGLDSVGVVGLGLMGHGIAQVTAQSSFPVIAYESSTEFLDKGRSRITSSIDKLVAKERLTAAEAEATLNRITYTTDMDALVDTDLVVEAVIENLELKRTLFTQLDAACKTSTIFASNTSSLKIADMAVARPDRFVGVHFFNPVQLMKLVEVIRSDATDASVFDKACQWVQDIGKVAVTCGDTPGFIVNRLLVPSLLQAMLMVDRNDATIRDIDISLKLGAGHPMGPLHLADYIGLDTCLFIVEGWTKDYPDEPAFVIPACLKTKVEAGDLGRKSGRGFYVWDGEKRGDPVE